MKKGPLATVSLLTLALATPIYAASPQHDGSRAESKPRTAEQAPREQTPRGPAVGSKADDQRYAMREAASPDAKNYKAGDVVVISVTTAVIVLLAVIILILVL
jgi:hypothetical protein